MTDHKVSDFVTKKSYHTVTLVSKYFIKATSDTVSVDPLLLFHQLITVEYRCAYVWAMCLSSSTIWDYWHHAAIQQPNAMQGWVPPSSTQIPQDVSYIYDGDALIHKIPWKTGQAYGSLSGKYIEYVKKKKKYDQPTFCLKATQVILPQKAIFIWVGRNHQAVTLLIRKRQPRYTA